MTLPSQIYQHCNPLGAILSISILFCSDKYLYVCRQLVDSLNSSTELAFSEQLGSVVCSCLHILSTLLNNKPLWEAYELSATTASRDTSSSIDPYESDSDGDSSSSSDSDSPRHIRRAGTMNSRPPRLATTVALQLDVCHKIHLFARSLASSILRVSMSSSVAPHFLSSLHAVVGSVVVCLVSCARIDVAFTASTYEVCSTL